MSAPCIHCSDCEPACPEGLAPQRLLAALLAGQPTLAVSEGLLQCSLCGRCDAVCPSQIALAATFADAGREHREQALANARADTSRARYRSRQARLLRDSTERAEQDARRRAQATSADAVAAAIARAKAKRQASKGGPSS